MSNLSYFLAGNAEKRENKRVVISTRFHDEKGNPILWEIRSISSAEDEAIRKTCIKNVPIVGKRNQFRPDFDANTYIAKLVTASVVYPDLNDAELQNSYGVMGAEALVKAMLYNDEFDKLTDEVMSVTDAPNINDLVEEAKN